MMGNMASGADLLSVAQGLRARIISQRDVIEASRRLPEELTRELARAGFFRIFFLQPTAGST
jgi:hypothetical protein